MDEGFNKCENKLSELTEEFKITKINSIQTKCNKLDENLEDGRDIHMNILEVGHCYFHLFNDECQ